MAKKSKKGEAGGTAIAKADAKKPKKGEAVGTALAKVDEKKLAKEFEARWNSITTTLRERKRQAASDILQYRYDVGLLAIEVMADREKELGKKLYGDRTVEQLCGALDESSSTVHACIKFARKVDDKELAFFKAREWPWRAVSSLMTVEDPKEYAQLKDDFEKQKFKNSEELQDAAKGANARTRASGRKKDNRGGSRVSMIKTYETACDQFNTKIMPNFVSSVKDFVKNSAKMESDAADETAKLIKSAKKAHERLKKMSAHVDEIIVSTGL